MIVVDKIEQDWVNIRDDRYMEAYKIHIDVLRKVMTGGAAVPVSPKKSEAEKTGHPGEFGQKCLYLIPTQLPKCTVSHWS